MEASALFHLFQSVNLVNREFRQYTKLFANGRFYPGNLRLAPFLVLEIIRTTYEGNIPKRFINNSRRCTNPTTKCFMRSAKMKRSVEDVLLMATACRLGIKQIPKSDHYVIKQQHFNPRSYLRYQEVDLILKFLSIFQSQ